ncbi:MAG TPA: GMC family oxidoreductase, partial [Solirubrobacteraceae bacterium]|nr:GMC family oxidoreductase [Solirubrobacteraceae bacterium]
ADVLGAARGVGGVTRRGLTSVVAATSHWSRGGWSALPARRLRMLRELHVDHQAEQAPHRDNRVLLGAGRDAFGMRRVTIDWRWHDEDVARTLRAQRMYADELTRAGVGRLVLARDDDGRPVVLSPSTGHYLGTTRMGATPRIGVVDARCRVHGAGDLYVAAGSAFPTGGFANPTLSIVALALRVADELKRTRGLTTAPPADVASTPAVPH